MKKAMLIAAPAAALLLACAVPPRDMEDRKPVQVERGFLSTKFKQDGAPLRPLSMFPVLDKYPDAKTHTGAAKAYLYTGMVLGGAGGFMVGYPIGYSLGGQAFNAPLCYSGLGVVAVSLIFSELADGKMRQATDAYNGALGKTGLRLQAGPEAVGLAWTGSW